jgi:hypothetical protein
MKRMEISTKWREVFPIENIIQFDLEHWGDWMWALSRLDHGEMN